MIMRLIRSVLALPYFFIMVFMAVIAVFSIGYQLFFWMQNGVWVGVSLSSVIFEMTGQRIGLPWETADLAFQWVVRSNLAFSAAILYLIMLRFLSVFRKSSYDSDAPYEDGFTRPPQF